MSNVIDLNSRRAKAPATETLKATDSTKLDPNALSDRELKAYRALRDLIEATIETEDQAWLERSDFEDYSECLDDKTQVIEDFELNYSNRTLGYVDFDQLTGKDIAEVIPADVLWQKIMEHSALEPIDDIYTQWNEMGSVQIGEIEHQINIGKHTDPGILLALANMSDAELERFNAWSYLRLDRDSFWVCGRPCERLVLKLDVESFLADSEVKAILAEHYEA